MLAVQVGCLGLLAGWFATGHVSAPDNGLLQLDILSLHQKVPGVTAVDGRPTMVVLAGRCPPHPPPLLPSRYGLVIHEPGEPGYDALARELALPAAARRCQPGYVLVDRAGYVRYRSYDPGWPEHSDEQSILLDAM